MLNFDISSGGNQWKQSQPNTELRKTIFPSPEHKEFLQFSHSQANSAPASHLVNEGGKLVIQSLDLLLLLALHLLDLWVNVNVDRPQEGWVHLHRLDASREPRATSDGANKAAHSSTNDTSSNATKSSWKSSTKATNSASVATAIRAAHGNPCAAPQVVEAPAAESSTASAASSNPPGCGERAVADPAPATASKATTNSRAGAESSFAPNSEAPADRLTRHDWFSSKEPKLGKIRGSTELSWC